MYNFDRKNLLPKLYSEFPVLNWDYELVIYVKIASYELTSVVITSTYCYFILFNYIISLKFVTKIP